MTDSDGKSLRALLSASQRRGVTGSARAVNNGLSSALDALDDLLEDDSADTITMAERIALKQARNAVLVAFAAIRLDAPDLSGFAPAEALREVTG